MIFGEIIKTVAIRCHNKKLKFITVT